MEREHEGTRLCNLGYQSLALPIETPFRGHLGVTWGSLGSMTAALGHFRVTFDVDNDVDELEDRLGGCETITCLKHYAPPPSQEPSVWLSR